MAEPYSQHDDDYLREHYPRDGAKRCARALGRTPAAIFQRACYLGLRSARQWTAEEDADIVQYYPNHGIDDICQLLPNRSRKAIVSRIHFLGIYLKQRDRRAAANRKVKIIKKRNVRLYLETGLVDKLKASGNMSKTVGDILKQHYRGVR